MSQYDAVAGRALATIARKGSDVSFATISGTPIYDPFTNTWSGGTTGGAVTGKAVQTVNDTALLTALGLIAEKTITLLIAAKSLEVAPAKGMTATWAGAEYNVDHVEETGPDGTAILFRVVASA